MCQMTSAQTFVIVGASLTGAKAAETLRTEGFDGRVVLIGEETERPYERPMLSKEYLRGEKPADKLYVHDEGFYADNQIELLTRTRVVSVDPEAREVTLADGSRMAYRRLLLSTGAAPRRLRLPGADLPGVRYLRQMGDSDALRAAITAASRVVVIGAGWIGSEVAASARQLGAEVAIVAPEAVPLERVLGPEVGAVYPTCTPSTGSTCTCPPRSRRSSGAVPPVACAPPTARSSRATWWSWELVRRRVTSWRETPA